MDEGTEVFRPTDAEVLGGDRFKVLPTHDYDPEDEQWEFIPGTVVSGVHKNLEGEDVLIAVTMSHDGRKDDLTL